MRWWLIIGAVVVLGVGVHYATDSNARFCLTHTCVGDFSNGNGYIVQCVDGTWSHSGGVQGACSYHGGEGGGSGGFWGGGSGGFWEGGPNGYGSGGLSAYGSGGSSSYADPATASSPSPPTAAALAAARERRATAERAAAAARAAAGLARQRTAQNSLLAITTELDAVNERLDNTNGVGAAGDSAELQRIQAKLTSWQIDHALDAPIGHWTPLQRLADAAFRLDSTLGLVIEDGGNGLWNAEWSSAVDAYNAALKATG